jgi:hypothetical protein
VRQAGIVRKQSIFVLGALGAVGWASASLAQAPTPRAPPSPQAIASAHMAADRLIDSADVGELFQNVSEGAEPMVRDKASGLKCSFGVAPGAWPKDQILVFKTGLPHGDDVGCNLRFQTFLVSLDVSRMPETPTLDATTRYYVKSVLAVHPKAKPYTGDYFEPSKLRPDFPAFDTVRLVFDDPAGPLFSRLSVAIVNGWVIEERVTGPANDAQFGDLLATGEMLGAIDSVHGGDLLRKP